MKFFYTDNRTAQNPNSTNTGFYSVVFEKKRQLCFSISEEDEKYPLEDAYKDFIETDLAHWLRKNTSTIL